MPKSGHKTLVHSDKDTFHVSVAPVASESDTEVTAAALTHQAMNVVLAPGDHGP